MVLSKLHPGQQVTVVATGQIPSPDLANVGRIANPSFVPALGQTFANLGVALTNVVTGSVAARQAGLRGAAFQSNVISNLVGNFLSVVPGVNLLSAVPGLLRLVGFKSSLPEYVRRELEENPSFLRGPPGPFSESTRLELIQQENVRSIQARQQAEAAAAKANERARLIAEQENARLRREFFAQRVPFGGIPGIFTRRARV